MTSAAGADGDFEYTMVSMPGDANSPDSIVRFLVGELVRSDQLPAEHAEQITRQVLQRESLGSTGIGRGFALPHSKSDLIVKVAGVIGRCAQMVDWGSLDGKPVRIVCLLVTPATPEGYLKAMQAATRQLRRGFSEDEPNKRV